MHWPNTHCMYIQGIFTEWSNLNRLVQFMPVSPRNWFYSIRLYSNSFLAAAGLLSNQFMKSLNTHTYTMCILVDIYKVTKLWIALDKNWSIG